MLWIWDEKICTLREDETNDKIGIKEWLKWIKDIKDSGYDERISDGA